MNIEELEKDPIESDERLKLGLLEAVRGILRNGLDDKIQKRCVRLGNFTPFAGGLKSDLVGGLPIVINATIKLGGNELEKHEWLMRESNRLARQPIFPEVLDLVRLDSGRYVLLMEELMNYETVLGRVYSFSTTSKELLKIAAKSVKLLQSIHQMPSDDKFFSPPPITRDPYSARISEKLNLLLSHDDLLKEIWTTPGKVGNVHIPPLKELLPRLQKWLDTEMSATKLSVVHGDPHLGNLMVRRYGRGFAIRTIDPNPSLGISDPTYDFGKLFHWIEEVGWAKASPRACSCSFLSERSGSWRLEPSISNQSKAAERRRSIFENAVWGEYQNLSEKTARNYGRIYVSIAAAHLGLATTSDYMEVDWKPIRRFIVAFALRALGRWSRVST